MTWTKDKPTVEGWYFWRRSEKVGDHMHWVAVFYEGEVGIWIGNVQVEMFKGGQWSGPINEH